MALTVEDGTGLVAADAYVSVAGCDAYCDAQGLTFSSGSTGDKEAAIRRATQTIDAVYRSRFPGVRLKYREQALEWPRAGAVDASGVSISSSAVPTEIAKATCEAAAREFAESRATLPDLERGGAIKSISAGSVSIEYGASAKSGTEFQVIDGILAGLIGAVARYSAEAKRG